MEYSSLDQDIGALGPCCVLAQDINFPECWLKYPQEPMAQSWHKRKIAAV